MKASLVRRGLGGRGTLEIHRLGPHPLIEHFLQRLDLLRILDKHIHSNRTGTVSHGKAICVLIHNILVSRDPLYRLSEWIREIDPKALGLTEEERDAINDDRIARALDQLEDLGGRAVFFQLALRSIKLFRLETKRIHFDTTTVSFTGEYRSSKIGPRIQRGYSKKGRPDLKQLVFGLNVTSDNAVPISHGVYPGNQAEDKVHKGNLEALRELLLKDDFIYVADSKLCTKQNLKYIDEFGGKFVTLLPGTRKEEVSFREKLRQGAFRWRPILTVVSTKKPGQIETYKTTSGGPKRTEDGFRLVWLRSSLKAEKDKEKRLQRLQKAEAALKELGSRLGRRNLKTRRQIKSQINKILKEKGCEHFLRVELIPRVVTVYKRERVGRPKSGDPKRRVSRTEYELKVSRDSVRLRKELKTDGIFALVTNLPGKISTREILQMYRFQPHLERRFENLKTEYSVAPVYLKNPKRVVGFLHACFLSLMVAALIERELRNRMEQEDIESIPIYPEERECRAPTSPRIFELFNNVDWFRHVGTNEEIVYPVRLLPIQEQVLKLLGVPKTVYTTQHDAN